MSTVNIPRMVLPVIDGPGDVPSLVRALRYMEAMPGMPEDDMNLWLDEDGRLLRALAAARPRTPLELAAKAEVAVRRLLAALHDGERIEEVELGRSVLRDMLDRERVDGFTWANVQEREAPVSRGQRNG